MSKLSFTIEVRSSGTGSPHPWLMFGDGHGRAANAQEKELIEATAAAELSASQTAATYQKVIDERDKRIAELLEQLAEQRTLLTMAELKAAAPKVAVALRMRTRGAPEGVVTCYDQHDEQIAALQGPYADVRALVLAAADANTVFRVGSPSDENQRVVTREEW